ncbi:MacS family sensor histidine kinase [Amycolatopsis sp. YIM 10]|uniref:MacS family sensor histidine kinase n=1 Tax=Amycolatopsis sp. YIM 10 TaxID=2653857 RepID=UPI00128FDFDF|nr:ATP-binding protein [Amycolatopsis sp. YIM 10]QFU94732.1 Signal transduction histidine-protein kinase/phosphatase DegS [Amycolatopsis sp. YIM 10]
MTARFGPTTRDLASPLWWGAIGLRVLTWVFAAGIGVVHQDEYRRAWLAWTVLGVMAIWTVLTSLVYAREALRWRWRWLVVADVGLTACLVLTSPWILSDAQLAAADPLITTVWAAVPPLVAGARFGAVGGLAGGLVIALCTGAARAEFTVDVARDGVLLLASGLLIGMTASTARRSGSALAQALRTEAATAERERLARSIHDSVLQVLARVRKRGAELGGEAAELAELAGEQEIALRALVTTEPTRPTDETADLRAALQLLGTSTVHISGPAGPVSLPAHVTTELADAVREALANVAKHAEGAQAWVLLEDLGDEVVVSVRDDGPGIPAGRLERARAEGRLGVAKSIQDRVTGLGGTISLDTAPGAGTEWEIRVPKGASG